jgi:hypothetical protein
MFSDAITLTEGSFNIFGSKMKQKSMEEIKCFFQTGNCEVDTESNHCCLNPTLVDWLPITLSWQVFYLQCPFFSFFPVPFNEQLGSIFDFETNSAYNYCKFN